MRSAIIFIIPLVLFATVMVCHSAGDPQRQLADERRRLVRPPDTAIPVQRVQPAVQQYATAQRERDRSQLPRNADRSSLTLSGTPPLQVVSIDRLKIQSDLPVEYQFETLQTLNVQEEKDNSLTKEVVEPAEITEAEQPGEASVEEVAVFETSMEISAEDTSPEEAKMVQVGDGHSVFRIVEEEGRIIVMQVEK